MNAVTGRIRSYWKKLGPGLVTGAADDDPSGIATYSQTGAQYGLQLIWMALFTLPLAYIVQEMCARIGMATGRGLGENIRLQFTKPVLYVCLALLFAANTFNIGADIAAMASGMQLIFPWANDLALVAAFALLSLWLQIRLSYPLYSRYLKMLALILFSYVITGFLVNLNWVEVLKSTVIPSLSFSKDQIILVCAILGTTISPYLFFWQASQEVEEERDQGRDTVADRQGATKQEIRDMRIDVFSGMFISELVMFFIIAVCAATLFTSGITDIETAADAARALRPLAGPWAEMLFTIGIIGTGLLSVPVLAGSSAYAAAEAFDWHEGLSRTFREAKGFYSVIILSMAVAVGINVIGIDPIKALLYSAVGNGIVAPVVLFLIMRLGNDARIMGENVNTRTVAIFGWGITVLMGAASLATLILIV